MPIKASSKQDLINFLPRYSLTEQDVFPKWKKSYIESNRNFFDKHKGLD